MTKVMIINGPNINMLGKREPEIYGLDTYEDLQKILKNAAKKTKTEIEFFQSNHEGELVEAIQRAYFEKFDGIIINPAAYTHTSVAILDALKSTGLPAIEVHISNVHARENFRRKSFISPACKGVIAGFGFHGYELALSAIARLLEEKEGKI